MSFDPVSYTMGKAAGGGGGGGGLTPMTPDAFDMTNGYVSAGTSSATFNYDADEKYRNDSWTVTSGHVYLLVLGAVAGNRFRAMFTSAGNPTTTAINLNGVTIKAGDGGNQDSPTAYNFKQIIKAGSNGYIVVTKSSNSETNIKTYCFDLTALGLIPYSSV